uniref:Vacuolar fusion protein MON1 homolog n=1 Tax=Glossina brevipalpis TaxID=37001 RepID=A0A1A9WDW8_9MUSC
MDLDAESNTESDTDTIKSRNESCSEEEIPDISETMNERDSPTNSETVTELIGERRLTRQIAGKQNIDVEVMVPSSKRSSSVKDYLRDPQWRLHKKHIFILTRTGKPVYTLHGNEENLSSIFQLIHNLINLTRSRQDEIESIETNGKRFAFLMQPHLILAAISKTSLSVQQLRMQLSDIYYQVLSILSFCHTTNAYKRAKNYNFGRLLSGAETLIHCLATADYNDRVNKNIFTLLTNSIQVLPLQPSVRSSIGNIIKERCKEVKYLIFAILTIDNELVTLIRRRKHSMNSADFRLIFNFVETLKLSEDRIEMRPLCLPRYGEGGGYLDAHISLMSKSCPACLIFLSLERDQLKDLTAIAKSISEQLETNQYLSAITGAVAKTKRPLLYPTAIGIPELRHFLYKPVCLQQLICAEFSKPFNILEKFRYLEDLYCKLFERLHNTYRPLKLVYEANQSEIMFGWLSPEHELYAVFDASVEQSTVIQYVNKMVKWIQRHFDTLFIYQYETF